MLNLNGLLVESNFEGITDIIASDDIIASEIKFEKVDEYSLDVIKATIHRLVDGKYNHLYSDNDCEEPSEIRYLSFSNIEIKDVTRLDLLIDAINNKDLDIYTIIIECYC